MSDISLAEVMELHPQLTTNGVGFVGSRGEPNDVRGAKPAEWRADLAEREAKVYEVVAWLRENLNPIQTPSQSSYQLKYLVEKTHVGYISNGEFIAAALIVGYPYRYDPPNVTFGVSALDIRRLNSEHR